MNTIKEKIANYDVCGLQPAVELADIITMLIGTEDNVSTVQRLVSLGARFISQMSAFELIEEGLTETQAVKLHAAALFTKKVNAEHYQERYTIRSPKDVADYLMPELSSLLQENFVVLYLNMKNEVIFKETIFVGSLNASIVHPREVFCKAVKRSAAAIICAHNHPSGNPTPSSEDIDVTKRLQEAGQLLGIECLDHVIIGDHQYLSLKKQGYM